MTESHEPAPPKRAPWRKALLFGLVALAIYAGAAFERLRGPSPDPHFTYLANTLNSMVAAPFSAEAARRREGREPFELERDPPHRNDWASYWELELEGGERVRGIWSTEQRGTFKRLDGAEMMLGSRDYNRATARQRYFVSFPPAPAFLMMPAAAIFGYKVHDVLWTLLFAATNVTLIYLLLARLSAMGLTERCERENAWLTIFFALGTAHFWCAVLGQVWFTALIMGVTFTLGYILCALEARRPLWAGLFLSLAFATRTPLLFTAPFFYLMAFFPGGRLARGPALGEAIRRSAIFSIPCLLTGIALMAMNYVRFGSPSEFGHVYLAAGQLARIQEWGLFHVHFLSKNLSAALTLLPHFQSEPPYIIVSHHGMSLLATSPALIWLFRPLERRDERDRVYWRALWFTVACCAIPGLFYQNTGYAQFGFRFSLDYTPYLIALLAVGRRPLSRWFKAAILASIAVNAFGAVTFQRMHQFYTDKFFP